MSSDRERILDEILERVLDEDSASRKALEESAATATLVAEIRERR